MPVLVKICGITNVEDAVAAARFGADFIGLNFYPRSSRCIDESQAHLVRHTLPPNVVPVALFVNESWELIHQITGRLGIDTIQVHRDRPQLCPLIDRKWIHAVAVCDEATLTKDAFLLSWPSETLDPLAVLLDSYKAGAYGGTGKVAPWHAIADVCRKTPIGQSNIILAGGLTPDNVAEAIRIVRPWGVDVASGVESSPGKKDHDKMRRFIENTKAAG